MHRRPAFRGTNDDVEARAALEDASPTLYDPWGGGLLFLPRQNIKIEPTGDELWDGVVTYTTVPATSSSTFSFDTGGLAFATCRCQMGGLECWDPRACQTLLCYRNCDQLAEREERRAVPVAVCGGAIGNLTSFHYSTPECGGGSTDPSHWEYKRIPRRGHDTWIYFRFRWKGWPRGDM